MLGRHFRPLGVAVLLLAVQFGAGRAPAAAAEPYDPWPGLVQDIFSNREINDGAGLIAIEMPYRAEDAAIVPVTLRATLPPGDVRRVLAITLVIDQNPAPMAARFELGQDASVSEISTRSMLNLPDAAFSSDSSCVALSRAVAITRQPRERYSRARPRPSPREAPKRKAVLVFLSTGTGRSILLRHFAAGVPPARTS